MMGVSRYSLRTVTEAHDGLPQLDVPCETRQPSSSSHAVNESFSACWLPYDTTSREHEVAGKVGLASRMEPSGLSRSRIVQATDGQQKRPDQTRPGTDVQSRSIFRGIPTQTRELSRGESGTHHSPADTVCLPVRAYQA